MRGQHGKKKAGKQAGKPGAARVVRVESYWCDLWFFFFPGGFRYLRTQYVVLDQIALHVCILLFFSRKMEGFRFACSGEAAD